MEGGNQQQQQPNPLVARSTVTDVRGQESFVAVLPESSVKRPGKVPFEKGYSQMDWLFLCRQRARVARPRDVTMAEVATHNTESDGWTVINDKVYEISPYLKYHPGGAEILRVSLGKDCTQLFRKFHAWVNYEMLLEKFLVGQLVRDRS
jgi:cytochrome-b5 reductase